MLLCHHFLLLVMYTELYWQLRMSEIHRTFYDCQAYPQACTVNIFGIKICFNDTAHVQWYVWHHVTPKENCKPRDWQNTHACFIFQILLLVALESLRKCYQLQMAIYKEVIQYKSSFKKERRVVFLKSLALICIHCTLPWIFNKTGYNIKTHRVSK